MFPILLKLLRAYVWIGFVPVQKDGMALDVVNCRTVAKQGYHPNTVELVIKHPLGKHKPPLSIDLGVYAPYRCSPKGVFHQA